jgi:hypothetical protein
VTDHHNGSIEKNTHLLDQTSKHYLSETTVNDNGVATNHSGSFRWRYLDTRKSKHPLITVADSVPPASQAATQTSQGRDITTGEISEPLMGQSVDELRLPPRLNLRESGLHRSERIKALQQNAHNPAHVAWGTRTKISMSALITLFSFVGHVTVPDHELPTHATLSDRIIKPFEELNE